MKYTVDRIEEGIAVCEDGRGNRINIDVSFLPEGIKEGDILEVSDGKFVINSELTDSRRQKMAEMQKSIFRKRK